MWAPDTCAKCIQDTNLRMVTSPICIHFPCLTLQHTPNSTDALQTSAAHLRSGIRFSLLLTPFATQAASPLVDVATTVKHAGPHLPPITGDGAGSATRWS